MAKAYTTRVGEGPLPTELFGEMGHRLRESGQEYGASTGRPRRCGWFDAVAVRFSARVNGLDALALTKLDVLDSLESVKVCVAYEIDGRRVEQLPYHQTDLHKAVPVYEEMPGWGIDLTSVTETGGLPSEARAYLDRLEAEAQDFHTRVRESFLALAAAEPERFLVVDAALPPQELAADIRDRIAPLL